MKLGTIEHQGKTKVVALIDENTVLDLSGDYADMVVLVETGEEALSAIRQKLTSPDKTIPLSEVEMRSPIMPVQYRDFMVHELHLLNAYEQVNKMNGTELTIPQVWYDQPIYYKGNRMSFIGDKQDVIWPAYSDSMDFELEMAIIIGKKGKDISVADAPSYIFGYAILNDISARDAQFKESAAGLGPAKGKDFDTGNILGPWILTADEVAYPPAFKMDALINGERWGGGNSNLMHHSFADMIAHVSQSETLYPGEVLGSGTVGTGCGLELGKRLSSGDTIELTIEKIGTLTNTIKRN